MMCCMPSKNRSIMLRVLWIIATFVIVDPQYHPIQSQELQSIVDEVKKDVDNYLKKTPEGQRIEGISLPNPRQLKKAAMEDMAKSMQDSMHYHLVRNLGPPSDLKNGITVHAVPTTESTETLGAASSSNDTSEPLTEEDSSYASDEVYEARVGSVKGVPGVNFPDYSDIPKTSFTCWDKTYFPGFYADLDAGCQVFHVCWPDRRESFLCPRGTIFNQALRVCDYWYNTDCSLAPYYYSTNAELQPDSSKHKNENITPMINVLLEESNLDKTAKKDSTDGPTTASVLSYASEFMPVKAKIVVYPETAKQRSKIVASASIGEKSKPNKSSGQKKPTRMRQSEQAKSLTSSQMAKLKSKIFAVRFTEALENILTDVKNDNSVSNVFSYVESVVKFLQEIYENDSREPVVIKPGNELYEYDFSTRQTLETFQTLVKKFVKSAANFMDELDRRSEVQKHEISHRIGKREAVKHAPLAHLNPKFIIKPATKKAFRAEIADKPVVETYDETDVESFGLQHKKRLHIYPETQKVLLRNYIKLFKTKRT